MDAIGLCGLVVSFSSAISAVAASLLAKQTYEKMVAHNKLSVLPRLGLIKEGNLKKDIVYSLENNGLGPAVIRGYEWIFPDGRKASGPLKQEIERYTGQSVTVCPELAIKGEVFIAAGATRELFHIKPRHDLGEIPPEVRDFVKALHLEVPYHNLYGDKATYRSNYTG